MTVRPVEKILALFPLPLGPVLLPALRGGKKAPDHPSPPPILSALQEPLGHNRESALRPAVHPRRAGPAPMPSPHAVAMRHTSALLCATYWDRGLWLWRLGGAVGLCWVWGFLLLW